MATKTVEVEDLGTVNLYKRRDAKSIKISLRQDGKVRVTMPTWVPYVAGVRFVEQKKAWVLSQLPAKKTLYQSQAVGRRHRLNFVAGPKLTSHIYDVDIEIRLPSHKAIADEDVQDKALKAAVRALKKQANETLPGRLSELAQKHGFSFNNVGIKQLKGRWGSCDQSQNITLNCFLMQIPDEYIDYVLLHELAHTKVLAHGAEFWAELERCLPNAKQYRKDMKRFNPSLA